LQCYFLYAYAAQAIVWILKQEYRGLSLTELVEMFHVHNNDSNSSKESDSLSTITKDSGSGGEGDATTFVMFPRRQDVIAAFNRLGNGMQFIKAPVSVV
jgi:hypothetical protein